MSEGTLGQCVECSKMGAQMFKMKSEVVGRSSVLSDDLVQSVDQKIYEKFRWEFSQISRSAL
jgi:hypothetical protein